MSIVPSVLWCGNDKPHAEHSERNLFGGTNYCSGRPERLPKYDPIDTVMRQWWCSLCLERGPRYNAGDPSVYAGWAVHVGKHERESVATDDD